MNTDRALGDESDELTRCRAALAASESRFRAVIENNADGVVVLDQDGIILYVNAAAERLLGCRTADCVGTAFPHPVLPAAVSEIDISGPGRPEAVAEMRVGETEWEGTPARLVSLRDVTDRKRIEQTLRQQAETLRQQAETLRRQAEALAEADRAKDEFLVMLAHELRNPLAEVTYAVHLMRPSDLQDGSAATWEAADRQLRHLGRIVDDLLDVARITRGVIDLRREPVNVRTAVRRVVERFVPAAQERGISLSLSAPEDTLFVEADIVRLEQVIANLVDNSLRFGRNDGGRVDVSIQREGGTAAIRVRDDGAGIPSDVLPHIFNLFRQADRSPARTQGGLGIGLTLVRRLVERHGGQVTATSDGDGRGSEFTVRLPLRIAPVATEQTPSPVTDDSRSFRILLVEDQEAMARMLATLLTRRGHEVHIALDGPAALNLISEVRPELVLLDIGLPGMDGYEVARRLRKRSDLQRTLLVALTGYGREEDHHRSREAGCDQHLVKPVSFAALDNLLAKVEQIAAVKH